MREVQKRSRASGSGAVVGFIRGVLLWADGPTPSFFPGDGSALAFRFAGDGAYGLLIRWVVGVTDPGPGGVARWGPDQRSGLVSVTISPVPHTLPG